MFLGARIIRMDMLVTIHGRASVVIPGANVLHYDRSRLLKRGGSGRETPSIITCPVPETRPSKVAHHLARHQHCIVHQLSLLTRHLFIVELVRI